MKYLLLLFCIFIVCIYLYNVNKNNVFTIIHDHYKPIQIEKAYYINMDQHLDRKKLFLEHYNQPWELERVTGVKVSSGNGKLPKGDYGCLLAHVNALELVSKQEKNGWYLIMEDDCDTTKLNLIHENKVIQNIVNRLPNKKLINLSFKDDKPLYSLNKVNILTTAYLVHKSAATQIANIVKKYSNSLAVDMVYDQKLRNWRYPFWDKDAIGVGCHVNLIKNLGLPSERLQING